MTKKQAEQLRRIMIRERNLSDNDLLLKLVYTLVAKQGGDISLHVSEVAGRLDSNQILTIDEYDPKTFQIRITAK